MKCDDNEDFLSRDITDRDDYDSLEDFWTDGQKFITDAEFCEEDCIEDFDTEYYYDEDEDDLDNENDDEDDYVEEIEDEDEDELNQNNSRFLKGTKLFNSIMISISAVLVALLIYMNFFMYSPKERDLNDDNIFNGNSLVVSDEEVNEIIQRLECELGVDINSENIDEYLLLNAVLENECLSEKEKDVFYGFIDMIKDNPYIDKEQAYRSLLNVDVLYKCRPFGYDKTIQGVYINDLESIGIFEEDEDNLILKHEGTHCIFSSAVTENLPDYFSEGMSELLVNEYFSEKPFMELRNYSFEIAAVKMLCEVTSPEVVLEAFSKGDMNIIIEDMTKITKSYDDSKIAVDMLEKLLLKHNGELEEDLSYDDIVNVCVPIFRGIVSAKYEEGDANREAYYYNEILLASVLEENPYDEYINRLLEFGANPKVYFSSKLKEKVAQEIQAAETTNDDEKGTKKVLVKAPIQ